MQKIKGLKGALKILFVAFLIGLDQLTKVLLMGKNFVVLPNVFAITSVKNTGFALGILPNSPWVALCVSLLVLCVFLFIFKKTAPSNTLQIFFLLIIGGALGNLIDRMFLGYVRDMFELLFIDFYVFNVADIFVTCGALLAAIYILFQKQEKKEVHK